MLRATAKMMAVLAIASGLVCLAPMSKATHSGTAWAGGSNSYFDFDGIDGTVNIINPNFRGFPSGSLFPPDSSGLVCANIYVFDSAQELIECCGCPLTNDGLRRVSEFFDLTNNPIDGLNHIDGGILIVDSLPNNPNFNPGNPVCLGAPPGSNPQPVICSACNPGHAPLQPGAPNTPALLAEYATHGIDQAGTDDFLNSHIGESNFLPGAYTASTFADLARRCAHIHSFSESGGRGICTCGTGTDVAPSQTARKR